jgi:hypothetical protein
MPETLPAALSAAMRLAIVRNPSTYLHEIPILHA